MRNKKVESNYIFGDPEVAREPSNIYENFVIVPVDKASDNYAFVCKRYYVSILIEEFGLNSLPGNPTYNLTDFSASEVMDYVCLALTGQPPPPQKKKKKKTTTKETIKHLICAIVFHTFRVHVLVRPLYHLAKIFTALRFSKTLYISPKACKHRRHICQSMKPEVNVTSFKSNKN